MKIQRYILILAFLTTAFSDTFSQKKVVDEEINITKEREISVPKADKLLEKIAPLQNETTKKKMEYSFFDRKPSGVEEFTFSPVVLDPQEQKKKAEDDINGYNNYLKLGAGNYGRLYGEGSLNSSQSQNLVFGISGLHNSTRKGPVDGSKSAQTLSKIGLNGKYQQNNYELGLNAGFQSKIFYFYGYDTTVNNQYTKENLRQRINQFNINVGFENTKPKPVIDYKLNTGIYTLNDFYSASELDWETRLSTFFPVFSDNIKAFVNGEAYLTQMNDRDIENPTRKRGLFRIEPGFNFDFGSFSARVGFKAVSQSDPELGSNITKGYPTATVSYKFPEMIYVFAGIDGDIIRNTMRSLLNENQWLKEQFTIQNTFKNSEYFVGTRGNLFSGLNFNLKGSYGKLQDLYYFDQYDGATFSPQGTPLNVTKFDVLYDQNPIDFFNAALELEYSGFDVWKPNLKFDYYYYGKGAYPKPYHRPAMNGRLGNTFTISNKLVSNVDLYYIGGIFAREQTDYVAINSAQKLKDIVDLNVELNYLFSNYLGAFVKLNNIFGQNYQRFYNYPQMGLNFMAGINLVL